MLVWSAQEDAEEELMNTCKRRRECHSPNKSFALILSVGDGDLIGLLTYFY